jgi:crotonobetainyl-CoA:carnitine CoA-transferase CaiB-like acyl-CoA transferase
MESDKPLEGLRVLDTTVIWGELAGRLLAELGAEVVRGVRDPDPLGGVLSEEGLFSAYRSWGKRRLDIDLRHAAGRAGELLSWADIWLDSARPGRSLSAQLDPVGVARVHPHLVITSVTPFGRTGPYSTWEATPAVVDAMSAMMFKAGVPEKSPLIPPSSLSNDIASVTATFVTLMAYWQKLSTGYGQHIDLSVMEAAAQTTDWSLPNASVMRRAQLPYSQLRAGPGIYGIYQCKNGFIRLVIMSPRQWRSMRAWLGEPEYLQDPSFDTLAARTEIGVVLTELYAQHFAHMDRDEAAAEAQRRGIAATPVLNPGEVITNGHLNSRGVFRKTDILGGEPIPVFAGFFEINSRRQQPQDHPPDPSNSVALDPRPSPDMSPPTSSLPLAGLRVLDFGVGGVGVEGGRLFAEYGADVIKVESSVYPDFMRMVAGKGINPSFASSSRSKRSLGVNLKHLDGLDLLYQLIEKSDVIIENLSTGTMEGLKLGYEAVRQANPRLVMVSSQLLGSSGPWSDWIGYGPSTQPISGLCALWDYEGDDPPAGSTSILPDHLAGRVLAVGAMAGLIARQRTRLGCHVEVAQVEVATSMIGDLLLKEAADPGSARPQGSRRDSGAPWGVYRCAGEQEWCVITVRTDDEWKALKDAMGCPSWAADPGLQTAGGRMAARERVDERLSEWTRALEKRELSVLLQDHGVPAGPMLTGTDQLDDPHLEERGYLVPVNQQGVGPILFEGPCIKATRMAAPIIRQAPWLGQHTREICTSLLDLSEEEVNDLIRSGALEAPETMEENQ